MGFRGAAHKQSSRESSGGQAILLRRQTTRKFGSATADELDRLLDARSDPDHLARIADVILECDSGEDFIARVRRV